jgi:hypothetical protein
MIDREIMAQTLAILEERRGLTCGVEENALFNDLNLRSSQPLTTALIREHLTLAQDKGWTDWKLDSMRAKRWRITPAGRGQLSDMKQGG